MSESSTGTALPGSQTFGPAAQIWASDEWLWEATRWIDAALETKGITRVPTTPRQPRVRPWSTQLVVDTDAGRFWFKAGVPEASDEGGVYAALRAVAPDLVPAVLTADPDRYWLLMPDAGKLLRTVADADSIVGLWSSVLRRYAHLQRASATVADRLEEAGCPRWEPQVLADRWAARGGVGAAEVSAAAGRLAELGLPTTIEHGDLHAGNVFCARADASAAQEAKFFDWGDAYLGNPLSSLLFALRGPGYHFGLPEDPERDARLVRAYAAQWSDLVPGSAVVAAVPDALLLARVSRALNWERALARADDADRAEWSEHSERWSGEIAELTQAD
ncbi:aminoglycoside phosphotransferase family protein [Dermacoccaceae bacterium W4C1]